MSEIKPITDQYDVPLLLIEAIIGVESDWNSNAVGDNGTSFGLFQLHLGGQADRAIKDGHKPPDLFDPLLNAKYAMPAIAGAWDKLKASFDPNNFTWWLDFGAQSGHPGGGRTNQSTINEATRLQKVYKELANQKGTQTMQADYPGAEAHFLPANRFGYPNNNGHVAIVIHKTGGDATPERVEQTFLGSGNSVHYAIGQDGRVWQFVLESSGAGGNCCTEAGYDPFWDQYLHKFSFDLNLCTISIEHCDPSLDNSTPLTPAQKDASFKLVAYLAKKYSIPASHIKTHASIDPINRARCPGNYPVNELLQFVQAGGANMGVPADWNDDGTTLKAPNGHMVMKGFRDYILNHPWDRADVPLQEEEQLAQIEESNTSLGAGSRQIFAVSMLEWTEKLGVKQANVGQELMFVLQDRAKTQAALAQSQSTVASLQKQLAAAQQTPAPAPSSADQAMLAAIKTAVSALGPFAN